MKSNTWCPLLTAAMILAGSFVQRKGRGSALVSARKRLIAACSSTTEQNTPLLSRRLVSLAKNPSTAFIQEADVGVKWKVHAVGEVCFNTAMTGYEEILTDPSYAG